MNKDEDALRARVIAAGETLKKKLQTDPELQKLAGTLLFSYRLAYWTISEICGHEGMTNEMSQWLIQAQDAMAQQSFNFLELMKDMKANRLPWLESRHREATARRNTLKKRAKAMAEAIRRKDIQLPFHSMIAPFGDDGFRHGDMLVVFGARAALELVLRRCSKQYRKAGGRGVFLSMRRKEEVEDIADTVVSTAGWRNAGDITASLKTLLDPLLRMTNRRPSGLVVIEDIDHLVTELVIPLSRRQRLWRAYMTLKQHQVDNGYAAIVGVPIDDDPGDHESELYPDQLLAEKRVNITLQEPLIIGGEPVIAVGNDVMSMTEMRNHLKEQ